ncbi:MAG: polysaccharide biosynthesis tyrosine autokinase [Fibrobacterales bacterium]
MNEVREQETGDESGGEMSIQELLLIVLVAWKSIIIITTIAILVGMLYIWRSVPIYKVDALIQVSEKSNSSLSALGDMGSMFDITSPSQAEIELLRSRMVLEEVVKGLKLDVLVQPIYFPLIGQAYANRNHQALEPVDAPFDVDGYSWGGEILRVTGFRVPSKMQEQAFILTVGDRSEFVLSDPAGRYPFKCRVGKRCGLKIGRDTLSIYVPQLEANPGARFKVTKKRMLKAIKRIRNNFSAAELGKQSGMLGLSLTNTNPDLAAQILNKIADNYVRQNVEHKSEEAGKTLRFLKNQLPGLRVTLEASENRLNQYRLKIGSIDLSQEASMVLQQTVKLESNLLQLKQKKSDLLRLYEKRHPAVQALDDQINDVRKQIKGLNSEVRQLPHDQQEVLRLSRDVEVNNKLYTTMLNNVQKLQVVKAGKIGNVRIVDRAQPTYDPIKPQKTLLVVLFTVFGIVLGIIWAFIRKFWVAGVDDPALVTKKFGLPVYATVPYCPQQELLRSELTADESTGFLQMVGKTDEMVVESLRSLRTMLHYGMKGAKNNSIMFTGPTSGIGKSFVSSNFAASLAEVNSRVLVMDLDMRRGHLHHYFGMARGRGMSEVLMGKVEIQDVIIETGITNLDCVSSGTLFAGSSELLMRAEFSEVLLYVIERYDYVILDAPPILSVTDSLIIGQHTGTNFLLLKHAAHSMDEIAKSKQQLEHAGVEIKGVIFNNVAQNKVFKKDYTFKYSIDDLNEITR